MTGDTRKQAVASQIKEVKALLEQLRHEDEGCSSFLAIVDQLERVVSSIEKVVDNAE